MLKLDGLELDEFRRKRTKRSELLIGVFIGIYGNWLIAFLTKLGNNMDLPMSLFLFSFFPLLGYFQEAYKDTEEQRWIKSLRLANILSLIYAFMILGSLYLSGLLYSELPFSFIGVAIWVMIWQVERLYWR